MRKRRRTKTIEDISVTELLDDFVELENKEENHSVADMDDEEYVAMMLKKDAKKRVKVGRKDGSIASSESNVPRTKIPNPPVVSERLSAVKRCQNCYFCIDSHTLGGSVWCHCTNPGRSGDSDMSKSWIKSKLNLPCWRPIPS